MELQLYSSKPNTKTREISFGGLPAFRVTPCSYGHNSTSTAVLQESESPWVLLLYRTRYAECNNNNNSQVLTCQRISPHNLVRYAVIPCSSSSDTAHHFLYRVYIVRLESGDTHYSPSESGFFQWPRSTWKSTYVVFQPWGSLRGNCKSKQDTQALLLSMITCLSAIK